MQGEKTMSGRPRRVERTEYAKGVSAGGHLVMFSYGSKHTDCSYDASGLCLGRSGAD